MTRTRPIPRDMGTTDAPFAGPVGESPGGVAAADRVAAARALLPQIQGGAEVGALTRAMAEQAREVGDGPGECAALYSAMASAALQADREGSRWAAARLAERGSGLGLPSWEASGRQYLARLQLADGEEDLALTQLVTSELLLDEAEPDVGLVVALNGIAVAYSRIGLHEDSERNYQRLAEVVYEAGDTWAVHAFVHNRQLNQAAWCVSLAQAGFADEAQERIAIASRQARGAADMSSSSAYHDFTAMCLFADLMAGEIDLKEARSRRDAVLENALGEPTSYVRFAFAHQLSNVGRWDEARLEVAAGLAAVNPNEPEPLRSALLWERARIAVLEYPEHPGVDDVWSFAQTSSEQVWRLRRRRMEAVHGKLRVSRMQREHERIERVSLEDPLTGTANRRRLDRERATLLTAPPAGWATVVYLDVDRFKNVNDQHGHEVGDAVLRRLARILGDNVRDGDLVGRYGGDEFVILAPHCSPTDAERMSERIMGAVRQEPWDEIHPTIIIRVSLGLAVTRSSLSHLFPAADEALYRAKRGGRDRVEITVIGSGSDADAAADALLADSGVRAPAPARRGG
jgi:diguanylate cyclase (GGDEF)-like protein